MAARRRDPTVLNGQAAMILARMKAIDKGQGCHATVETIGRSINPRFQSFSRSQCRRYISRLRNLGEIHPAGQTKEGRTVYVFADGSYPNLAAVPVCPSRPMTHLQRLPNGASWATDKAREILSRRGEVPSPPGHMTLVDGVPINQNLLQTYSQTTLRNAIAAMKKQYDESGIPIHNPSNLLRKTFIPKVMKEQADREAAAHAKLLERARTAAVSSGDSQPLRLDLSLSILERLKSGRYAEALELHEARSPESSPRSAASSTEPTVSTVLANHLQKKGLGPAASGNSFVQSKASQLERLIGPMRVAELTQDALSKYKQQRRAEHVGEATIKAELKVLHQALRSAASEGVVRINALVQLFPAKRNSRAQARGDP